MGADTLQVVKRTLEGLSILVAALPVPEPFKSAVVGIPDAVLGIITILEVSAITGSRNYMLTYLCIRLRKET